jgi:hypothetical protein
MEALLSWQTAIFSLGIYILVYIIRTIVDPTPLGQKWYWSKVVLQVLPPILGAGLAAVLTMYPFPEGVSSMSMRVFYGLCAGFFSSWAYKLAKGVVKGKADSLVSAPESKTLPPKDS